MNTKKRRVIAAVIMLICVVGGIVGYQQFNEPATDANAPTNTVAALSTDGLIQQAESKIQAQPENIDYYIVLATLYLQKVRETADVSYYAKVLTLMDEAEKLDSEHPEVYALRATVALGKHDFTAALPLGEKAVALNPNKAAYYGIVGDAFLEQGKYDQAIGSFQMMLDTRPDFSSYSRIAYVREIYGDIPGAIEAFELALSSGSAFLENTAWAYVELGKLYLRTDVAKAKTTFERALALYPEYPPAYEGLGKVAVAEGDLQGALTQFDLAFAKLPIAQYAIARGDVYTALGDSVKAAQQFTLAEIAFEYSASGGVNTDLEMALFLADHDVQLSVALEKARAGYALRPSIFGADVLAWALFKNGQYDEAQQYITEALRLGQHDALILFHAGMIAKERGDADQARTYFKKALELNPHFSIQYAAVAQQNAQ